MGILLVDLLPIDCRYDPEDLYLHNNMILSDPTHPSVIGHQIAAHEIFCALYNELAFLLTETRGPRPLEPPRGAARRHEQDAARHGGRRGSGRLPIFRSSNRRTGRCQRQRSRC